MITGLRLASLIPYPGTNQTRVARALLRYGPYSASRNGVYVCLYRRQVDDNFHWYFPPVLSHNSFRSVFQCYDRVRVTH